MVVFVVLDGLDASGKSTQAERLREFLVMRGGAVYTRIHPSNDCWAGISARRFLLCEGRSAHLISAILYTFDVLWSIVITPWWLYDYVIFVRYLMGTAYLPSPLDRFAYRFFALILPRPEYKFYLAVSPEEARRRIVESRSSQEMFESLEQLREVGVRALSLARMDGWIIIDANKSEEEVESQIRENLIR
jgi:dTMP kinase